MLTGIILIYIHRIHNHISITSPLIRPSVITPPRIIAAVWSDRLSAVFFPSNFSMPRKIFSTSWAWWFKRCHICVLFGLRFNLWWPNCLLRRLNGKQNRFREFSFHLTKYKALNSSLDIAKSSVRKVKALRRWALSSTTILKS